MNQELGWFSRAEDAAYRASTPEKEKLSGASAKLLMADKPKGSVLSLKTNKTPKVD